MQAQKTGGFYKPLKGTVKCAGTSETKVIDPLQRNFTKVPEKPNPNSKALIPKQQGSPE